MDNPVKITVEIQPTYENGECHHTCKMCVEKRGE